MKRKKSNLVFPGLAALVLATILVCGRYGVFQVHADTVTMFTQMDYDTYHTGNQFQIQIFLDTATQDIVAAQAVADYATDTIQIDSIDTSSSDFTMEVKNSNDSGTGHMLVAVAKPTPGVNSATAKIATVTVTALKDFTGQAVLTLKFDSALAVDDCAAIADDGNGTNVLEGISNQFVHTGDDSTPPVRSGGAPSGTLSSGTTQTNLSLTTDENATCLYSTSAGTAYGSMTNDFLTTDGTSHSANVSGLSDGSSYTYYVRCEDGSDNPNTNDFEISFSIASGGSDDNGDNGGGDGISRPKLYQGNKGSPIIPSHLLFSDSKSLRFKGNAIAVAGGTVKLYKGSHEAGGDTVDSDGGWSISKKVSDNDEYTFRFKYYDDGGNLVKTSSKFRVRVDTKNPNISNFPLTLRKRPGAKIWWSATDNDEIRYYKYTFQGKIKKTTHAYFYLPAVLARGKYFLRVKAFDRVGNFVSKKVTVIVY